MRKNKLLPIGAVLLAAVLVITALVVLGRKNQKETSTGAGTDSQSYRTKEVNGVKYRYNSDLLTLLFLGIDSSDGQMHGQSDAIDLVIFDRKEETIKILSISRDSMVPIQIFNAENENLGWERQHLALASSFGSTGERGCLLAAEAVSRMIGEIPVVYYGAADISSIASFQELVGELRIPLPEDFIGLPENIPIENGAAVIVPENAESFVRVRDIEEKYSNDARMKRQQLYIDAYIEKLKQMLSDDFNTIVRRMKNLFPLVLCNISIDEVTTFAEMLLEYQFNSSEDFYTVEGSDQEGSFHDEFIVDEKALEKTVLKLFYKKEE